MKAVYICTGWKKNVIQFHVKLQLWAKIKSRFHYKYVHSSIDMLMVHSNVALVDRQNLLVDRKFHDGMSFMVRNLGRRIVSVHPKWSGTNPIMDKVNVPLADLPYDVLVLDIDGRGKLTRSSTTLLKDAVANAELVVGQSMGAAKIARLAKVPYMTVEEYDLPTQIVAGTAQLKSPLRKLVRGLRIRLDYYTKQARDSQYALGIHSNGYPAYNAVAHLNNNRLLYLDSRLLAASVIASDELERRVSTLGARPLRLLYSGRLTAMKGVLDAVKATIICQRAGMNVELSLYGQGEDQEQIENLISTAPYPHLITVHHAVEFPKLMAIAKSFDLFVCCHVQSDPSCTYVESFGAGLPIVGYNNAMWSALEAHAAAGIVCKMHDVNGLANSIVNLSLDHVRLAQLSRNARKFAVEHSFEVEIDKRIGSFRAALSQAIDPSRSPSIL